MVFRVRCLLSVLHDMKIIQPGDFGNPSLIPLGSCRMRSQREPHRSRISDSRPRIVISFLVSILGTHTGRLCRPRLSSCGKGPLYGRHLWAPDLVGPASCRSIPCPGFRRDDNKPCPYRNVVGDAEQDCFPRHTSAHRHTSRYFLLPACSKTIIITERSGNSWPYSNARKDRRIQDL